MIGAQKYSKNKTIPTIKLVTCPDCGKDRLQKTLNADGVLDPVSEETVEVRGKDRFLEVCEHCSARYQAEDKRFVKENLHKLSKAITKDNVPDGQSDHKDFSLN